MFIQKIKNIQPLRPGGTTIIKLPTGKNAPTLDRIQFKMTNGGAGVFDTTKINAIRGNIGGAEFYTEGSATTHNLRRTYLGRYVNTAELVIDFTEPNAKSGIEQYLSAIPLSLTDSFYFELDIDATANAALTLEAWAYMRMPTANPFIKKLKRLTQSFAAASTSGSPNTLYLPNGRNGGKLMRVWIHEGIAGNITAAELRVKSSVGIEIPRTQMERTETDYGLVPQASVFCLDFIADGNLAGWFDTSGLDDVQLNLVMTAADALTVYLEYLDPIVK